jgi:hypothetical protein
MNFLMHTQSLYFGEISNSTKKKIPHELHPQVATTPRARFWKKLGPSLLVRPVKILSQVKIEPG